MVKRFFSNSTPDAKLIIGLGNHGTQYNNTRHNVGFMALDNMAQTDWKKEKNYLWTKATSDIILIKPTTYMNLSGNAVLAAMKKYKVKLSDITVIHDDIDLRLGDIRIKTGGGNAGHNGLKSISAIVGNDYKRIRIGVGRPENPKIEVSDWVLSKFTKDEMACIKNAILSIEKNAI